tara:strand:+ start:442 stop:948 length:507 start_codon:yes stop_codon:yes gene_type:complete
MGKWTKKSNAPHPVTHMYHGCEKVWRIGEGFTKAEVEFNKFSKVPVIEFSKFFDSIPNLIRTPNNVSTRLRADCNKMFHISGDVYTKGKRSNYSTTDTYSKHVLNVGFPSFRWSGRWKVYVRPLGAKILLNYLNHVGKHWYFRVDGSIDLSVIREHAKAVDHLMKEAA